MAAPTAVAAPAVAAPAVEPAPLQGPGAGCFMREELTASAVLSHAARWHPRQVVVDGDTLRETTWADLARRAFVLGVALRRQLLPQGEAAPAPAPDAEGDAPPPPAPAVVATLAFNSARHLEAWYAVSAAAAGVVHTLNPRLSPPDLRYILASGGASVLFCDALTLPLLRTMAPLREHCPRLRHVVVLCDRGGMPPEEEVAQALEGSDARAHCHEALIEEELRFGLGAAGGGGGGDGDENGGVADRNASADDLLASLQPPYPWPCVSEESPAGLAYTSGTTGLPKGCLFSHRVNFLNALASSLPDALCLGSRSTVLMAVPMFHANGWQLPHAAPMTGARLVFPHPSQLSDGARLLDLIQATGCDSMACVPTVWQSLVAAGRARRLEAERQGSTLARPLGPLRTAVVGGSACPRALAEDLELEMGGVCARGLWGMTELAPIASVAGASRAALDDMMRKEEGGVAVSAAAAALAEAPVADATPTSEERQQQRAPPYSSASLPPTAVTPTVREVAAAAGSTLEERAAVAEGLLRLATGQGRPHCFVDYRIVRRRRTTRKRGREGEEGEGEEEGEEGEEDEGQGGDEYEELPHDGVAFGHLQVRGATVIRRYHRAGGRAAGGGTGGGNGGGAGGDNDNTNTPTTDTDTVVETLCSTPALRLAAGLPGYPRLIVREWFDTGDVGSIHAGRGGALHLTDRAKDVIKSGGEWISSLALESAASTHPRVAGAAAVGVPHVRWGERPLLVVALRPPTAGAGAGEEEQKDQELKRSILAAVASDARLAKWQLPDDVVFVPALPLNATGKINKLALRRQWRGHYGGAAEARPGAE